MLVAKVTCVWLSPSVSVHVLKQPAGFWIWRVCWQAHAVEHNTNLCSSKKKKEKSGLTAMSVRHAEQRVRAGDLSVSTCPSVCSRDELYWCSGSLRWNLSSLILLLRARGGNQGNSEKDVLLDCRTQHVLLLFVCVCDVCVKDNTLLRLYSSWTFSHTVYLTW